MLHVKAVLVLVLLEVAGASLLALCVWAGLAMQRRARDRRAVKTLIASVEAADAERRAGLRDTLAGAGVAETALDEHVATLVGAERRLYKAVIDAYLGRDAAAIAVIDAIVGQALDPYRALLAAGSSSEPATSNDDEHVEALREQNAGLREELEITKRTMRSMLSEYAQMYERGDGAAGESTARRILSTDPRPETPQDVHRRAETTAHEPPGGEAESPGELAIFDGPLDVPNAGGQNSPGHDEGVDPAAQRLADTGIGEDAGAASAGEESTDPPPRGDSRAA